MHDEHEAIQSLSYEQVLERARAISHEAEYWRAVLDDLAAINVEVGAIADQLANGTVATLSLTSMVDQRGLGFVSDTMTALGAAMQHTSSIQALSMRLLELAGGRAEALEPQTEALRVAAGVSSPVQCPLCGESSENCRCEPFAA